MTTQNPMALGLQYAQGLGASQSGILGNQGERQRQALLQQQTERQNQMLDQKQFEAEQKQLFQTLSNVRQLPTVEERMAALQASPFVDAEDFAQFITPDFLSDQGLDRVLAANPYAVQPEPEKPTAFVQELMAAGFQPGSDEFKDIIRQRYGKGAVVSYDSLEGVNPETGELEYFQLSKMNPGEVVWTGVKVPEDPKAAAAAKAEADAKAESTAKEKDTLESTLSTVKKIITSPGLSGFTGLDSFRRFIPGSEAANVAAWVNQLQSQNFLVSIEQMKGMGALSENEGKKLANAVAALDSNMSDDAFLRELQAIEADLLSGLQRIQSGELLPPSTTAPQTDKTGIQFQGAVNWADLP